MSSAWSQAYRRRRIRSASAPARAGTARGCRLQLLRRLGYASRFVSGYLIQMKADVEPKLAPKAQRRTLRTSCVDRGLSSRRRVGGARSDFRPVCRRGAYPARRNAALPLRRAGQRGCRTCRGRLPFRDERLTHRRGGAITKPFTDARWRALLDLGAKVDADCRRRMCA